MSDSNSDDEQEIKRRVAESKKIRERVDTPYPREASEPQQKKKKPTAASVKKAAATVLAKEPEVAE